MILHRVVNLPVSYTALERMLRLPDNARIINFFDDPERAGVVFRLESPSFPEVQPGNYIPEAQVIVTTNLSIQ